MKYFRDLVVFLVLLIDCGLFLLSVHTEVESKTIAQVNTEQMFHVKHAAKGIERFFQPTTAPCHPLRLMIASSRWMMKDCRRRGNFSLIIQWILPPSLG